jgi:hypothetical protein
VTESEQDPWRIELVPLRTSPERRDSAEPGRPGAATGPAAGVPADFDLVNLISRMARTLERVESRLARIERTLKLADPDDRADPPIRRLRRQVGRSATGDGGTPAPEGGANGEGSPAS